MIYYRESEDEYEELDLEVHDKALEDDFIKILEETQLEFINCNGGNTRFVFEDKEYHTDTGYAIEGIEFFVDRIKSKLHR